MMDLGITKDEIEALNFYYSRKYEAINQMLVSNCETDIALLSDDVENKSIRIEYNREAIVQYVTAVKDIYRMMLKHYYKNYKNKSHTFYRGTNIAEVERVRSDVYIDRFLAGTTNPDDALNKYCADWNRPAYMTLNLDNQVPFMPVGEYIEGKDDILISPFTKITYSIEDEEKALEATSKVVKSFTLDLSKQDLEELVDQERFGLYNYILENAYSINHRIEECISLEKENVSNFENIRKLEQQIAKYENSLEEDSDETEEIDIDKIYNQLDELKEASNLLFEKRKNNINYVNIWKRNIAVYVIAECKLIENSFEDIRLEKLATPEVEDEVEVKEEKQEEVEEQTTEENNEVKPEEKNLEEIAHPIFNFFKPDKEIEEEVLEEVTDEDPLFFRVKTEAKENVEAAQKLLRNINALILKQQNHAKVAGNLESTYSALNNAFEMRRNAEDLLDKTKSIKDKVYSLCDPDKKEENEEEITRISKGNIEISTLINYLNNPRVALSNNRVDRFSEMCIIEENELKRGISQKIRDIRGEAELKKLKDDLEYIESKGAIEKFFGIFTGKNKYDEFMIEQIDTRQKAIRKTLSKSMGLAHNYSIHELMAEITMFIEENADDELIQKDVNELRKLADLLKKSFIISDSKVKYIVAEKEGRNLPVELDRHEKISKMELLEIETYRFLNKYGYDIKDNESKEPEYQDTMANEINRVNEYIKASNLI